MMTRSRRRIVGAGVALSCVIAAACSPDREQQAVPTAPPVPAATAPPATAPATTQPVATGTGMTEATEATEGSDPGSTAGTDAPATTVAAAETTVANPAGPTFGDLPWPCGPAEAANTDDGSVPGVTATEIQIGIGDDAGFSLVPGLNHEATDTMNAMVAKCNELGGINGRTIVANYYDSKLTEVSAAVLRACGDQNFFLVGEGWAFDDQQEEIRQGCDLPAVPVYSVGGAFSHAPLMYQPSPNPTDEQTGGGLAILAQEFPAEVQSAGALTINISATTSTRDKILSIAEEFGWNFVSTDILTNPMGETDYTPFIDQLESAGVEVVFYSGQCFPMLGQFAQTAATNGYEPIIIGPPNMYEPRCAEANTDGSLDNMYFYTDYVPMFEAEFNKATQDYLDVIEATGGDTAALGMGAASSFLLWAHAADSCGPALTRECTLDYLANVHEWTGGGLHAPTDPGGNHPSGCSALFKFSGTEFERVFPEDPATFECDPSYIAATDVPALIDPLLLDENRVSHLYTD